MSVQFLDSAHALYAVNHALRMCDSQKGLETQNHYLIAITLLELRDDEFLKIFLV
jgi:hypothetical protein